jgi:dephospho-CoA kinase
LVRAEQDRFRREAQESGAPIAVLDIPLLFETGGDKRTDAVVVVSAPADVQRTRLLERPGATEDKIDAILARQMSDAEKRARADFVVDTSRGFDAARADVRRILEQIRKHGVPKKS